MADARAAEDRKLRVFISYSRKDEDFAQELLSGLQLSSFEPYLDKHDIVAGEDWKARLGRLIEAADTVVFVISPDAVASERCAWEVEHAATLKKRILPVVWRSVEETKVPQRLKQLNYIFFDRPLISLPSLIALATALTTDIEWVREHTRLGEAALRWDQRGRAEALLLRSEELAAAKAWLASQPKYAPDPTLLHHEFIKEAEDSEAARTSVERKRLDEMAAALEQVKLAQDEREKALRRGKRALVGVAALFVCIIAGAAGWYNQDFLKEQYQWRVVMVPSVLTADQEKEIAAKPGSDFKECANGCPTMIVVPAGKFTMGSPETEVGRSEDEGPQHEVTIVRPFAVGMTHVTEEEWNICVVARACPQLPTLRGDNNWPVVSVSWEEAKGYVTWLKGLTGKDYRLLSEAEWEYSARAGNQGRWSFGDDEAQLGEYAWFRENSNPLGRSPVAFRKPNSFGLYDMHGNASQWVDDPYHDSYVGAPLDGSVWGQSGDDHIHVNRGGNSLGGPQELRSAKRDTHPPLRNDYVGFRVARTLTP